MRKLPHRYDYFYKLAKKAKLSNLHGRAICACSRVKNGSWTGYWVGQFGGPPSERHSSVKVTGTDTAALRTIKPSTAQRWADHWAIGGAIQNLKMSQDAWNFRRAAEARDARAYLKEERKNENR